MNARLFESERQQRNLANALREISLLLSGSLNPDVILRILLEQVRKVVPYDSANVMLIEDDNVRMVARIGYEKFNIDQLLDSFSLPLSQTNNLQVMATSGTPNFISDVRADLNWNRTPASEHIASWVGAPLIAKGQVLGFLGLDKVDAGYYRQEHAARLEMLAGHASLALLNAQAYQSLEQDSITDFVTGAFNHRYFFHQLQHELEQARVQGYPVTLLMIDIDHFKPLNDVYGHPVGDQVLHQLATRLKAELRTTDHLARYGGEEFTVILPGTPLQAALDVAERLRSSVEFKPFGVEGRALGISVSIGCAAFPTHAQSPRELVNTADQAMYTAKAAGRNCVRAAEIPL